MPVANFLNIRFPLSISFGTSGGPERRTEIIRLSSGREQRNSPWAASRRRFDVGTGLRHIHDLRIVAEFFERTCGQLYGFRFQDPFDHQCGLSPQALPYGEEMGRGDGRKKNFQLIKRYGQGEASQVRRLTKPVPDTVRIYLASQAAPADSYRLDPLRGQVIFTSAPANGTRIGAAFQFDIAVRFDIDRLELSLIRFNAGQIPSIPIIELTEESITI